MIIFGVFEDSIGKMGSDAYPVAFDGCRFERLLNRDSQHLWQDISKRRNDDEYNRCGRILISARTEAAVG
jgi:hypothetical protein